MALMDKLREQMRAMRESSWVKILEAAIPLFGGLALLAINLAEGDRAGIVVGAIVTTVGLAVFGFAMYVRCARRPGESRVVDAG